MNPALDVAVVGAGAAGLAAAIFTARRKPALAVAALDGARKLGAKILVSGGGRCNVTNSVVTAADFRGGSPHVVRRTLDAFTAEATVAFFREIGVALHEEPDGKLFPDTNRARTVLDALVGEAHRRGVRLLTGHRVTGIARDDGGPFSLETSSGRFTARRVVLATGGLSLPRTGSDGLGYRLAAALGHTLVPSTPALVPLLLEGDFHAPLSGIAHAVELTVRVDGKATARVPGAMLWTHFGVSGPAALDASRFWHQGAATVGASFFPGMDFPSMEEKLLALARAQPRTQLRNALSTLLPAQVAAAVLDRLAMKGETPMAHLSREDRRTLVRALLDWPLPVRGSRGYNYAEVTAGGVPLDEIDPSTFESRRCPGLYLVGEILDVDGRIGGFNFQWAWSSAWVAAAALS